MSGLYGMAPIPQKRRVFFSFHYQNDIWRVNQVRNSWRYQNENRRQAFGFYDGSIWERSQRTSDDSLKNLIREGVKNTSVTCVLAGNQTYARRWVRYEIARSVLKGNGLLTVKIHNMRNQKGQTSTEGQDPLDYMGVYQHSSGMTRFCEFNGTEWVNYSDYTYSVTLPDSWPKASQTHVTRLSAYARSYCYINDAGHRNFAAWVRQAAIG